jgi:uncharacterized GH25 family protein
MKSIRITLILLLLVITASAHDMFLKFDRYFLAPNAQVEVRLFNGEFNKSENTITRDRMRDVSLLSPAGLSHPPETDWRDEGKTSILRFKTGAAGTYVAGTSTKPKELSMKATEFNRYLQLEGVIDTFVERRKNKQLNQPATERYSKHVKAVFQVGNERTETYKTPLGYPVEIIPQQNPYNLKIGDTLMALCVRDGSRWLINMCCMACRRRDNPASHSSRPVPTTKAWHTFRSAVPDAGTSNSFT